MKKAYVFVDYMLERRISMDPKRAREVLLNGEHDDHVVSYLLDLIDRDKGALAKEEAFALPAKHTSSSTEYLFSYRCGNCELVVNKLHSFCPRCGFRIGLGEFD